MAVKKLTAVEVLDSLTGFEEIAIRTKFGQDIEALQMSGAGRNIGRALGFVIFKRAGDSDDDAYKAVMEKSFTEISELFAADEDEIDEDEPETDSGKDDSKPARKRATSQP